jgi:DNA-binding NarL/FixJ family response regulator
VTTIILADDHRVIRQGLRALLEVEADFKIIGESGDGLETIQLVEKLHPDVLVLDLMMGGINGLEVARQLTKRAPKTSIVILSMHSNETYVIEALKAGAKAYVLKEATSAELVRAVREAAIGRHYLSAPLSEQAIEAYIKKAHGGNQEPEDRLTTREREVLHLAAQGLTNAEIGTRLYISRRTVEVHRTNMMRKIGLRTQTDLIRYALQRGILTDIR